MHTSARRTHLATYQGSTVTSSCGRFAPDPDWTTSYRGVTCPRCLEQLGLLLTDEDEGSPAGEDAPSGEGD